MVYSLVSEFSKWLSNATERNEPHVSKPFRLSWLGEGKPQPGIGLDLSRTGIVFATSGHPRTKELTVRAQIRDRSVPMRLVIVGESPFVLEGKAAYRFSCKLVGIGADDWDLLQREIAGEAEPENVAAAQLNEARKKDDDAYRLLPLKAQRKIVSLLVEHKRLEQPAEGTQPALRLQTLGRVHAPDGRVLRRINVHSRRYVADMDAAMAYDTQITIDDDGNVELLK